MLIKEINNIWQTGFNWLDLRDDDKSKNKFSEVNTDHYPLVENVMRTLLPLKLGFNQGDITSLGTPVRQLCISTEYY